MDDEDFEPFPMGVAMRAVVVFWAAIGLIAWWILRG